MWFSSALLAVSAATAALGCPPPPPVVPSNNITEEFSIQVQNPSYPAIHNRIMNLWSAGGGDQHLYLAPAGDRWSNMTLILGMVTAKFRTKGTTIRAVINGEYTASDNTTKIFMTERSDPRAIFDVRYGCNPDTDTTQTELVLKERSGVTGGHVCVRLASGNRHEFRYSPPGNTAVDLARPCMEVTLAVIKT